MAQSLETEKRREYDAPSGADEGVEGTEAFEQAFKKVALPKNGMPKPPPNRR